MRAATPLLLTLLTVAVECHPFSDWAKLGRDSIDSMTDGFESGMRTLDREMGGVFDNLQNDFMSIDWKVPSLPKLPDMSDMPTLADLPDMPDMPDMPDISDLPDMPDMPTLADLPKMPSLSDMSWSMPQLPEMPRINSVDLFGRRGGGSLGDFFANDPFSSIFNRADRPWWEGDNVCVDREVLDGQVIDGVNIQTSGNTNTLMQVKSCEEREGHYKCQEFGYVNGQQKTIKTVYSCCHGFKVKKNQICEETDVRPTEETLADLDGTDFLSMISEENLVSALSNSTVFLPDNDAIDKFQKEIEKLTLPEENGFVYNVDDGLKYRRKREIDFVIEQQMEMKIILLNHILPDLHNTKDFSNNQVISTKADNHKIRMSVYNTHPVKLVMANCALVTSKDHHTTTGVVHVVDRVIKPVSQTLGAMLTQDLEFSTFMNALDKSYVDKLFDENSNLTVFVPTNAAFKSLDPVTRDKVLGSGACGSHILRSHILSTIVCSGAMQGRVQVTNDHGDKLIIHRADSGELYADRSRLVIRDIVGTNGVIHVVDKVIIPSSAKTIREELQQRKADKFLDLIEKSKLHSKLDRLDNFTFFLPSNAAMELIPGETLASLESDPAQLEELILHHALPKRHHQLSRSEVERSVSGKAVHARLPKSVSCARVFRRPSNICGGSMFTIDRLLLPPVNSMMEVLANSKEHTHFHKLLIESELSGELDGTFTIFAPTDQAFKLLEAETQHKIFGDKEILKRVIKNHISNSVACCSTPPENMFPWRTFKWGTKALSEETLFLHRAHGGRVFVNQATVERCDMVAKDGIVHSISSVLLPNDLKVPKKTFSFWKI